MITTEFFKTLKEAKGFKPICIDKEIYSLDLPGTEKKFRSEQNEALQYCRHEALNARAVVVMYR